MSDVVRDAIAAALAEVEREYLPPATSPGYGSDISCVEDLRADVGDVEGVRVIGESLARLIQTPRGSLADAPDRGIDLREYLGTGTTIEQLRAIEGAVRAEWKRDDRVDTVDLRLVYDDATRTITGRARVVAVDGQSFELVLRLTDAEVLVEAMYGDGR